ncbi:DUF2380 domain-containing protein [Tardiphaga sp.]|uniref:DUF2380 domain-containing protein n=1 Tax=Tardiphaga sp. TaxID=1926292 RepID=UPI0026396381|nr:DUF2380 domain-containing protein [Tardiphaga sp.]MDB5621217.1 hypothetical protein [Tardiphaga sp.]
MATGRGLGLLCALALMLSPLPSVAQQPITIAVTDFDYVDTSGEAADQAAVHRDRMVIFAAALRDELAQRDYRVVRPNCPHPLCTAAGMAPDDLVATARREGARYLVYGGVHKMSTLVQ